MMNKSHPFVTDLERRTSKDVVAMPAMPGNSRTQLLAFIAPKTGPSFEGVVRFPIVCFELLGRFSKSMGMNEGCR